MASASLNFRWLTESQHWLRAVISNESGSFNGDVVEKRIATQLLSARHEVHQAALKPDDALREWLGKRIENGTMGDLSSLTSAVQMQFPNYVRLAVCSLQSPSVEDLLQKAFEWGSQSEKSFTHQAIVASARSARLGFECVIVTGERLPDFQPGQLSRGHDNFYILCPLCHRGQACEVPPLMRSVTLECPQCHRPYVMLAVDTKGRYHHANEFLTGYAPPARFPAGITRLNEMLLIWNSVVQSIRYVLDDADGNEKNDAWQTAAETQKLGTGDCEDSSIYLADWLIARGFNARVALGHYAERGGHAWVIVQLDGETYLLECTNPEVNTSRPPLIKDVGSRYVPDCTFDREGFYSRKNSSVPWDGDYWSQAKWQRVIPTPDRTVAKAVADTAK
ncbi:MAG: hypothetical protein K8R87_09345 [Verrucomicrobia bacterium]|nr:hypothetical protein [Verrucomicrobiota bacterium]